MQAAALTVREVARERAAAADVVALGRLDLDHVGAEIGEQLAGVGGGDAAAVLDDAHPFQRERRVGGSAVGVVHGSG